MQKLVESVHTLALSNKKSMNYTVGLEEIPSGFINSEHILSTGAI